MTLAAVTVTVDRPFVLLLAIAVGVLACARVVRLFLDDDFPPTKAVREWYVAHVPEQWGGLAECPWCLAPYVVLVDILWAWGSGLHWTWWFGNAWAGASWLVSYISMRDVPPENRL